MSTFTSLIIATRPKTLLASISPVIAGTALAFKRIGTISFSLFICTLFSAALLQIASNLFNDLIDFKKGADTEGRLGPVRATQSRILSPNIVLFSGILSIFIAICFGIPLVISGGSFIFLIGISAAISAYCYTGGPYPLAYNGLGELFVLLYYGIIAVSGTFFLQTNYVSAECLGIGTQVGLFSMALIALNNYRDIHQDKLVNKRTIAVRLGESGAKFEVIFFLLCACLFRFSISILTIFFVIPLAIQIYKSSPSKECNRFIGRIALTQLLYTFLISIELLILT